MHETRKIRCIETQTRVFRSFFVQLFCLSVASSANGWSAVNIGLQHLSQNEAKSVKMSESEWIKSAKKMMAVMVRSTSNQRRHTNDGNVEWIMAKSTGAICAWLHIISLRTSSRHVFVLFFLSVSLTPVFGCSCSFPEVLHKLKCAKTTDLINEY